MSINVGVVVNYIKFFRIPNTDNRLLDYFST